jgi:hypothetical protein
MLGLVYKLRKTWALAAVVTTLFALGACAPSRDLALSQSCSSFEKLATGDDKDVITDLRTTEPRMDETAARHVRQYTEALAWLDSHDVNHPDSYKHTELMTNAYLRLNQICDL